MSGQDVKAFIKNAGVKLWEVAEVLGMTDGNFSRRLRKPFNDNEVADIKRIVNTLTEQNEAANN